MFSNIITIHSPWFLLLLLMLIALIYIRRGRQKNLKAAISFPQTANIKKIGQSNIRISRFAGKIPFFLRIITLVLIIAGLMRFQERSAAPAPSGTLSGVDIIITLDTSPSMNALDFNPDDRLTVAKRVISNFINARQNDRIGLVVFSGAAITMCPLTTDYAAILSLIPAINQKTTQTDGTAIGDALATSINRLKNSKAKSKIIVLLTDGRNNLGHIDPISAAELAGKLGIKIYTIGIGKQGESIIPMQDIFGNTVYARTTDDLDEVTLSQIAELTQGIYSRAQSVSDLTNIFQNINSLEKTDFKAKPLYTYTELFNFFLIPAFLILLLEILLSHTLFRKLP